MGLQIIDAQTEQSYPKEVNSFLNDFDIIANQIRIEQKADNKNFDKATLEVFNRVLDLTKGVSEWKQVSIDPMNISVFRPEMLNTLVMGEPNSNGLPMDISIINGLDGEKLQVRESAHSGRSADPENVILTITFPKLIDKNEKAVLMKVDKPTYQGSLVTSLESGDYKLKVNEKNTFDSNLNSFEKVFNTPQQPH